MSRCEEATGCHGVAYEGTLSRQKAFELKLDGDTLTLRWYDGPSVTLKRVKPQ